MVLLFIKSTQTFSIYDYNRQFSVYILLRVEDTAPEPKTLGAWVDGGTHLKALKFWTIDFAVFLFQTLQKEFIEQVGLARSILSSNCYDTNLTLNPLQKLHSVI